MNEDYLWDKKGGDVEIEKLENALKSLRYRKNAAPLIPARLTAQKQRSFSFLPLAAPAMACLFFLTLIFWFADFNNSSSEIVVNEIHSQTVFQPNYESPILPTETTPDDKKPRRIEERNWVKRRIGKIRKPRPATFQTLTAQKIRNSDSVNELTKEEKYAYDQLMTALAITSSQFKLVKDKIQGIENQEAVVDGKQ
jgi:hypothetical protein